MRITDPRQQQDYQPCPKCGRYGYIDERKVIGGQHLCARCAHPHIEFD